ncbi:MAG: hypothetical protein TREMPRED_004674 [Tremellales sp. Tagirdzhanova-0007]|nr:MAG: hypothetical protein TREMPRED_004674 [Tremellales sp. Tagirdzhanova-0007]
MLSSRTLSVALTFASTLSFGVNALPHWTRELSVSSIAGDIGCPAGQSILTIVNKATIPDTSPGEVWSYIGDFCNVAWEGFDLISTQGACNTPGQTHTFSTLGLTLSEKLILDIGSSSHPDPHETFFAQAWQLLGEPSLNGAFISNTFELLRVTPGDCGAEINWDVISCSTNTTEASEILKMPYQNDVDIMQLEKFCFNADIRTENIYDMGENGFLMGRADAQRLILRKDVAERLKKSGEPEARMNGN